jgi:aldehyde:ferredoxin oxidoreductase
MSTADKYKQLKDKTGQIPENKKEKMKILRQYREKQYENLLNAVYERRGWNSRGVPKIEFLRKIGMDLPEVIEVVKNFQ